MRTFIAASALAITLTAAPQVAVAQSGNAPFCLKTLTGEIDCTYPTLAQCELARRDGSSAQCITRSDAGGTTGLGERPVTPPGSIDRPSALPPR